MSRSTPSLLALLGLVAVAGYQNRGRIGEMLSDAQQRPGPPGSAPGQGDGGFLSDLGQVFQGSTGGASISTALTDLVNRFRDTGRSDAADSWVSDRANMPLDVRDLEATLGPDTLDELTRKTGLTRAELLLRLNVALPEVVNRLTPNGRLPAADEAESLV